MIAPEDSKLDKELLGKMLRVVREEGFLTVRDVASATGLDFSHLSQIELGRPNISVDTFVRICAALGIPPGILVETCLFVSRSIYHVNWLNDEALKQWADMRNLAEVEKKECADFIAGSALVLSYLLKSSNPLFFVERIEFVVQEQKGRFEDFARGFSPSKVPETRRALLLNLVADTWSTLRDLALLDDSFLEKYLAQNKAKLPKDRKPWIPAPSQAYFREFAGEVNPLHRDIDVLISATKRYNRQRQAKKTTLTNVSEVVNVRTMKPHLPILLGRLQMATTNRGGKTALAKFLQVPLARVSQWLTGDREPGGETTLRLLEWVTAEEAQQNKKPETVKAASGRKTQVKGTSYETKKTGPRKK